MLCYVRLHYAVIWYMVWCSTVLRCLSLLYQGISFQTRASIRVQGFGVYTHLSVCQNFLFMARPWMIWGGSYRLTTIRSHVSVRYRFALVKVRRLFRASGHLQEPPKRYLFWGCTSRGCRFSCGCRRASWKSCSETANWQDSKPHSLPAALTMTSHPAQSTPTKSRHAKEPWSKEGVELCKLQGRGFYKATRERKIGIVLIMR